MMDRPLEICILAAGLGKRLKSTRPKVLQTIAGRPMLSHLLDTVSGLDVGTVHVVIGSGADLVRREYEGRDVNFVLQSEQLGTGHAVMQALPDVASDARLLILLGDAPLVRAETLARLVSVDAPLGVLTVDLDNPFGYGRILRCPDGNIDRIVEERDCTDEQRRIAEINTGVMVADAGRLRRWLDQTGRDNDQREYLLTDIVSVARREGEDVAAVKTEDPGEVRGVNTMVQLAMLEREYQGRVAKQLMEEGVQLMDPARIDVRGSLEAGRGSRIDVNCVFEGECRLGEDVTIESGCVLRDADVGDGTRIRAGSWVEGAVGQGQVIGPHARIMRDCEME